MKEIPAWYGREFVFSFPAAIFPNVCARLRGTPARLQEALSNGEQKRITEKVGGKWSAQEHVGHLLNLEPLWLARVNDYVAGATELTVTDLQNRATDEAHYNEQPRSEILAQFRAARTKLLRRVGELEVGLFSQTIVHPRLKIPMRLVDHLFFVAEHDDHHLAHIWELLAGANN